MTLPPPPDNQPAHENLVALVRRVLREEPDPPISQPIAAIRAVK
ncbi:hypothetical protein SAMN02746041_00521 [Desulfacinum hydrothermale DSM 13146]|uniref:Uncharacterized protein n=1 Tax=Desulfacinum hydrothermale DSM 13146 TaxID=1121390 RepID=A0A1W1X4D1_9BACT|nr:hypothetical protein [Desulfacinum hydrothermale]SMC18756.1 hypothetical protein SAMN02746041_00521 [Desulfacinum hydrothermale DSM 13146]